MKARLGIVSVVRASRTDGRQLVRIQIPFRIPINSVELEAMNGFITRYTCLTYRQLDND